MNINRRADRGRMGKSQRSGKPFGFSAPLRIPLSGIPFSPSLLQAKDDLSINVRKILDTTFYFARARFFLLKGKENFFAGLCSERAGRRGFASARARRNSPHTPLPPRPRLGWRKFLRRA